VALSVARRSVLGEPFCRVTLRVVVMLLRGLASWWLRGVTLRRIAGALNCLLGAERMDGAERMEGAERKDGAAERKDGAECMAGADRPIDAPPPPRPLCWAVALVAITDATTRQTAPIRKLNVNIG